MEMKMIQIDGLTKKQVAIAELLWSTHSEEDVLMFCRADPEIKTVYELMVAAMMDLHEETEVAEYYLREIMEKK